MLTYNFYTLMYKKESFIKFLNNHLIMKSIFLEHVGYSPRMKVMQYLIEGRDFDYSLTDMLNADVSWGTLNTIIPKMLNLCIIIKTRKIGRATLYKINENNIVSKQLIGLYDDLIREQFNQFDKKMKLKVKL